jgi:hypothetical protein
MTTNQQPEQTNNHPTMRPAVLQLSYRHTNNVFNNPLLRVDPVTRPGSQGRHVAATAALKSEQTNTPIINLHQGKWEETCYKATHSNTCKGVEYKQLHQLQSPPMDRVLR